MKKRIIAIAISIMAVSYANVEAQSDVTYEPTTRTSKFFADVETQPRNQTILYKSRCCITRSPQPIKIRLTDEENNEYKKTSVVWPNNEKDSWMKDTCWVKAPVISTEYYDSLFPGMRDAIIYNPKADLVVINWMLAIENDETVLHCFFTMPADIVTNLFLAMEETAIVDLETGVNYRIKRTEPECMRKHIGVKAKKGDILDFKIYFPKLSDTTSRVSIYTVPLWSQYGGVEYKLTQKNIGEKYDDVPNIISPTFVSNGNGEKYNKDNWDTWRHYKDAHLIKPVKDGTMALWNTPDATYIAVAHEQNSMGEYYAVPEGTMLIDDSGNRYTLKQFGGGNLPIGELFWIDGYSGDFHTFLMEFEPLPPTVTSFSFIEPDLEPFYVMFADPHGTVISNLNVNELRKNQSLFKHNPRVVKE